jgi:hypothetical protein
MDVVEESKFDFLDEKQRPEKGISQATGDLGKISDENADSKQDGLANALTHSADSLFEKNYLRSLRSFIRKERISKCFEWLSPGQITALEFFVIFKPKYMMGEDDWVVDLSFPDPSFIGAVTKYDLEVMTRYGLLNKKIISNGRHRSCLVGVEFELNENIEEDILPIFSTIWEKQKLKRIERAEFDLIFNEERHLLRSMAKKLEEKTHPPKRNKSCAQKNGV